MDFTSTGTQRVFAITPDLIQDGQRMADIISNGVSPLAVRLLANAKTFSPVSDRLPVMKALSSSGGSFAGMDILDRTIQDPVTYTRYEVRALYQGITLSGLEKDMNALRGGNGLAYESMIEEQACISFKSLISDQFYVDGTANSNKDIIGLATSIASTGTYAGISRTTYPNWQSSVYDVSATSHSTSIANSDNGFNLFRRMLYGGTDSATNTITRVTYGSQRPTLIVIPFNLWSSIDALYTQTLSGSGVGQGLVAMYNPEISKGTTDRYKIQDPLNYLGAHAGYQALWFAGIPIVVDEHCPSGTMFFINENFIQWKGMPSTEKGVVNYDLEKGPMKVETLGPDTNISNYSMGVYRRPNIRAYNQYGEAGDLMLAGALEVFNPRYFGKITNLTA
jgi:hypothetical protein